MRLIFQADAAGRIAAQRHDVAHACGAIIAHHLVDLLAARLDASEMRGGNERGLAEDALDGRVRALARRAAGAVGDGDEARRQRRQALDRIPQVLLHLLRLRREELEGDADRTGIAVVEASRAGGGFSHHATSRPTSAISVRGSRASHSETAILPSDPSSGTRLLKLVIFNPAAAIHCVTVSSVKPRRRCACCSRRNSSSCGAKSTTVSRPPGRSTRAASRIARPPSSRKCSTWWTMTASKLSLGMARS